MKAASVVQIVFEVLVGLGFLIGLFPFGYLLTLWWVIPLTIVNLVLSLVTRNKTHPFTITNVIMAFVSMVPILGFLPRIVGIVMSACSIVKLSQK